MAGPSIKVRKLAELNPDPRNARVHDEAQVALVRGLIERFGWTIPMLVDEGSGDLIVAGHCRRLAAQAIYADAGRVYLAPGAEHGGSALPKGAVPVIDCTGWPEEKRRAYALADNRSAETSTWDLEQLGQQLDELAAANFDISVIGFDQAALDELAAEPAARTGGTPGELEDTTFSHEDQFAVIIRCADAAEREARFIELRDRFGADNVKVVVV